MSHDPVLVATRKVKTGLLVVSSGAILFEIFDLQITSIPALGLENVPIDLVPILLKMTIIYQEVSFLFRFLMDIANASDPNFYELSKKRVLHKQERFIDEHAAVNTESLKNHFRAKFPQKEIIDRQHRSGAIHSLITHIVAVFESSGIERIKSSDLVWQYAKDIENYLYDKSNGEGIYYEEVKVFLEELLERIKADVDKIYTGVWERLLYRWANIVHLWLFEFALPIGLGACALTLLFF